MMNSDLKCKTETLWWQRFFVPSSHDISHKKQYFDEQKILENAIVVHSKSDNCQNMFVEYFKKVMSIMQSFFLKALNDQFLFEFSLTVFLVKF